MATFTPTPNALVKERFRLVREIGRGGMGAVWEALDLQLDAPCALKFILDQESRPPEVRARFLREARAVAKLRHPRAVSIWSVDEWEGALFIAMELLSGETLFARLARERCLSARETARIVEQLASVLSAAHLLGIVHRDLKPENVWLWGESETFVKLLDFGIAKQVADTDSFAKTATGALLGTPYYMSPEQAKGGGQVDHRSDVWSLAVIAVECLCGRRVYQGVGLGEMLANIINGPTPSLSELYPAASPQLLAWWQRALAKMPEHRYASAVDLAADFAAAVSSTSLATTSDLPAAPIGAAAPVGRSVTVPVTPEGRPTVTTPIAHQDTGSLSGHGWPEKLRAAPAESVGPLSSTNSSVGSTARARRTIGYVTAAAVALGLTGYLLVRPTEEPAVPQVEESLARPTTQLVPAQAERNGNGVRPIALGPTMQPASSLNSGPPPGGAGPTYQASSQLPHSAVPTPALKGATSATETPSAPGSASVGATPPIKPTQIQAGPIKSKPAAEPQTKPPAPSKPRDRVGF